MQTLARAGRLCLEAILDTDSLLLINANSEADTEAAALCGAHGVHLPEWRMGCIRDARRTFEALGVRKEPVIGVSAHSVVSAGPGR
jgi:hypothetical protein